MMGIKALFICWGRKNQLSKTSTIAIEVKVKYFFTQSLLLFTKNAIIACVGHAQSKLKLFLHIAWSVPVHINSKRIPRAPERKKNRPSNPCKRFLTLLLFTKPATIIPINNKENTISGVKKDWLLLAGFSSYKLLVEITH